MRIINAVILTILAVIFVLPIAATVVLFVFSDCWNMVEQLASQDNL